MLAIASVAVSAGAAKRPITETDLYAFRWIASPQISPDGAKIVYTLVTVNAKHDNYETSLWIVPASGGAARQLTSGPRDSSAPWSPDSRTLVVWLVLREVAAMLAIGTVLGLGASLAAGRLVAGLLYGVKPYDAAPLAIAAVVLAIATGIAAYLPAHRAARLDPMAALREE
jgi:hypothetical protein